MNREELKTMNNEALMELLVSTTEEMIRLNEEGKDIDEIRLLIEDLGQITSLLKVRKPDLFQR